jgi:hypothetical protein
MILFRVGALASFLGATVLLRSGMARGAVTNSPTYDIHLVSIPASILVVLKGELSPARGHIRTVSAVKS